MSIRLASVSPSLIYSSIFSNPKKKLKREREREREDVPSMTRSFTLPAMVWSWSGASLLLLPACWRVTALYITPAPTAMAAAVAKSAVFWSTPSGHEDSSPY